MSPFTKPKRRSPKRHKSPGSPWTLSIVTFGADRRRRFGCNYRARGSCHDLTKIPAFELNKSFRGSVVAAGIAFDEDNRDDHNAALIRLQEFAAEMQRRDPEAGAITVVYEDQQS